MRPVQFDVEGYNSVKLRVYDGGTEGAPAIMLLHGLSQSALCWRRQLIDSALTTKFRLVAVDLRGHGASSKPLDAECYRNDQPWAEDLARVLAAAKIDRVLIVAWSFAGRVLTDYLRLKGSNYLAGVNFVCAVTKSDRAHLGPNLVASQGITSPDLDTNIAATRNFLRSCFYRQPSPDDFEFMLAYNMMVPPEVRAAMTNRSSNPGDLLSTIEVPVLITHGAHDRVILPTMSEFTRTQIPGSELSIYPDVGHSPFWEDAGRFNLELGAFAARVFNV